MELCWPLKNAVDYMNILNFGQGFFRTAKEVVFYVYLCVYMHKPTPFREEVNEIIRNAATFGLIEQWVSLYNERLYSKYRAENKEPKPLSNNHILGGYELFAGGMTCAFIAFLLEILSTKIRFLRKFFDYLGK